MAAQLNRRRREPNRRSHSSVVAACAAMVTALVPGVAVAQVPCNPAIDGTYCATANIRSRPDPLSTEPTTRDTGLGRAVSGAGFYEQPATLGAITFGSSQRCIGLIRRVNCSD